MPRSQGLTAERISREAFRLFAEQGYDATSITQIEEAVGLSPGAGGLYRHYSSKEAILESGLDSNVEHIAERATTLAAEIDRIDRRDIREQLRAFARVTLDEKPEARALMRILFREGERLPRLLATRERITRLSYDGFAAWLKTLVAEGVVAPIDADALSAVCYGALLNFWTYGIVFGSTPAGIAQRRFVETWVDATAAAIEAGTRTRRKRARR
jgi:AcrR family transcriptional regulator